MLDDDCHENQGKSSAEMEASALIAFTCFCAIGAILLGAWMRGAL